MDSRTTPSSSLPNSRTPADSRALTRARDSAESLTRALAAAGIAGVLVGIPAGLLLRLIMKVSALAAGAGAVGLRTENGNVVGALTSETLALVFFAGVGPAVTGAVLYVAVRPWLLAFGRWRGLVLGAYLLGLAGPIGLDPTNFDFARFGPASVNVAMFCAVFIVVGIALAPVADGALARVSRGNVGLLGFGFLVGALGAGLLVSIGLGTLWSWLTTGYLPAPQVAPTLMAASAAIALAARFRGVSLLTYVALAVPLAVGIWFTGNAIVTLLS